MDLRNLWRRRLEVLIANLREGEQEHREIASLAEHIGADYHSRFLVELLQNASDSAADASLEGAKVIVVRTSELVAIANQGLPFNEKGVRSITSLGMSPKDPRFFIGNKGIGFKAVFEVTDSPEIFSAGASDGAFVDDNALRLRLHTHPFDQPRMAEELRNLVTEVLDHHRDFFEIMAQRGEKDPVGYVLEEARHAAPFKFPLPVGKDELDARLRVLGGFNGEKLQTLIVLPLLQGPRTQGVVDEAIKDLLSRGGATLLFLPSVVQIIIQDRVQNRSIRVSRSQPGYLDEPTKRDQSFFVKTSVVTFPENVQAESEEIPWIVVRRRIGGNEAEAETSDQVRIERERIRETASALPGDTWKKVDFAEVSVALSLPEPGKPGSGLPIPDGRICIGLPTKDRTGTPFWVDARFHGTISRKEIDLTLEYNHILFGEAVGLARELVERLKAHPELPTRRAVTLAMEVDAGPLAEEFRRSGGVLHAEVVLSPDGMSFVKASSLALMRQDDAHIVERSRAAGIDVEQYGFHLAEAGLLRNFRPLLDRLIELTGGQPPPVSGDARFLQSISHGQSLIETLASHYRTAGDSFWGPFMDWVVSRFPLDRLLDQHILPIGDSDLAQPSSHVFYRPAPRSDTAAGGGEEVDIIPDQVRLLLRFLDERQIRIRGEDGRTLTPLARRLSPEVGTGLVESPRKESLLNEALIPRLKEVTSSSGDDATAILLLELAARWTETKDARKGPRIRFEELLVPTLSDGKWIWHPPDNVYGGSGWQAGKDGELMDAAYGAIPKRRLVPWKDFAARGRYSDDFVGWWRDAMVRFGVLTTPKIVRTIPPQAPLEALANQSMAPVKGIRCPLAQATEFWESYLAEVSRQTVLSKKGRRYTVRELLWIEGLEWGVSRAAVVELILRHPEVFEPVLETSVERADGSGDSSQVQSMWVHSLRTSQWKIVPTGDGFTEPSNSWWLEPDQRSQGRYRLLRTVPSDFERALPILRKIGVCEIHDAPTERLISTLQDIAESLPSLDREGRRNAYTLTLEFYTKLQRQAADGVPHTHFACVLDRRMPLRRGQSQDLVPVDFGAVDRLYFDDDPVRAQHIEGIQDAAVLPIRGRTPHVALLNALRGLLGAGRVIRTSEAGVELGFAQSSPSVGMIEHLKSSFPSVPIESDLAVLLTCGSPGRAELSPEGEDFKAVWNQLLKSEVAFGQFPPSFKGDSFYESHQPGNPVLMVASSLEPYQVLAACWAVVGLAHRDVWSSYAHALELNQRERFFFERQIGVADREEVEAVIFRAQERTALILRPALLALWGRGHPSTDLDFVRVFERGKSNPSALLAHFAIAEEVAAKVIRTVRIDDDVVSLLPELQITIDDYQAARVQLGLGLFEFGDSKSLFERCRDFLAANIAALSVHSSSVDLGMAKQAIDRLREKSAPPAILSRPPDETKVVEALVDEARGVLSRAAEVQGLAVLTARIESLRRSSPTSLGGLVLEGAPKREVESYQYDSEAKRSRDAETILEGYLRVASPLAAQFGEVLDTQTVQSDVRVKELTSGWWANRFGLLAVLRETMERHTPKTALALSDVRAFHEVVSWRELWLRIPVLGSPPEPSAQAVEAESVFLGLKATRAALEHQLAKGSGSKVGERIKEFTVDTVDFSSFRSSSREEVALPTRSVTSHRARPTRPPTIARETRALMELHGATGEAFVFEQMRRLLPNFDETCWMSENRVRYGLEGPGRDDLGYDFEYRDVEGKVTGRSGSPLCLLEVKSTTGEGSSPFPVSAKEWDVAEACHRSERAGVYLIVRVEAVAEHPRISDILFDPVNLKETGVLVVDPQDLWIHVGEARQDREK